MDNRVKVEPPFLPKSFLRAFLIGNSVVRVTMVELSLTGPVQEIEKYWSWGHRITKCKCFRACRKHIREQNLSFG